MTQASKYSGRLLELDVLRGFAALSVMCFHYTVHYAELYSPQQPALFNFPYGVYGVDLFFTISGFVIFMTLEKTKRPLDFIVSRFSRLYPAFWVAVFITYTIVRIFHLPGREVSHKEALMNLFMYHFWLNFDFVDGVYWTLSTELAFYFVMFLLFVTKKLKHIEIFGLALLITMVWNDRFLWIMHAPTPQWIVATRLLVYGHFFFAGILFYNLKTKGNTWYRYAALALCLLVQYMLNTDINASILGLLFFLIFYFFITGKLTWIVNKPMIYLGTISYSFYLIHQNIGYVIIRYLYGIHANAFVRFFVPACCAVALATAITYGVEKPAMNFIRTTYKNWKQAK
jgi:peptidoglycan/LPS O-acetylase OafA/YrhL